MGEGEPLRQESWDEVPRLDGVRVLVVEDVVDIRQLVVEVLEEFGAQVAAVGSAVEGLNVLKRERPNVLLSNIVMPGKDGFWLIRQVRGLPPEQGGNTPAAAFTGDTIARDGLEVLRAGFQFYVPKPVDLRRLVEVVAILSLKK